MLNELIFEIGKKALKELFEILNNENYFFMYSFNENEYITIENANGCIKVDKQHFKLVFDFINLLGYEVIKDQLIKEYDEVYQQVILVNKATFNAQPYLQIVNQL